MIERSNLTTQMSLRRFTRLTNAFSKQMDHHCQALALYFMWYNFARLHKSTRMSLAITIGLTNTSWDWDMENVVHLIDRYQHQENAN